MILMINTLDNKSLSKMSFAEIIKSAKILLSKNDYYVKVNSRSGAIPSNVLRQTKASRAFQAAPP